MSARNCSFLTMLHTMNGGRIAFGTSPASFGQHGATRTGDVAGIM